MREFNEGLKKHVLPSYVVRGAFAKVAILFHVSTTKTTHNSAKIGSMKMPGWKDVMWVVYNVEVIFMRPQVTHAFIFPWKIIIVFIDFSSVCGFKWHMRKKREQQVDGTLYKS